MIWTRNEQLRALMRLPWTVNTVRNDEEGYYVARVSELPDAIATGADESAVARELYASLWSSLSCRLEFNDEIPLPAGVTAYPWEGNSPPRTSQVTGATGSAWDSNAVAAGEVVERSF